jgi:hypothetical protein
MVHGNNLISWFSERIENISVRTEDAALKLKQLTIALILALTALGAPASALAAALGLRE